MYDDEREEKTGSIVGGWLGTYRYGGLHAFLPPVRFEASFRSTALDGCNLYGEITDDSWLGTAAVSGGQAGNRIWFVKSYGRGKADDENGTVEYAGMVSDDGQVMRGTWRLDLRAGGRRLAPANGTWEARRMWSELEECDDLFAAGTARAGTTHTAMLVIDSSR